LEIVIPTDHLSVPPDEPSDAEKRKINLLDPAPPGQATFVSIVLTEPGTRLTAPKDTPSVLVASWALQTRGTISVVAPTGLTTIAIGAPWTLRYRRSPSRWRSTSGTDRFPITPMRFASCSGSLPTTLGQPTSLKSEPKWGGGEVLRSERTFQWGSGEKL
jgi:hypothetical protein